jgi:hypothetical protein
LRFVERSETTLYDTFSIFVTPVSDEPGQHGLEIFTVRSHKNIQRLVEKLLTHRLVDSGFRYVFWTFRFTWTG